MAIFELLYFEDCPSWKKGLELFQNVIADLDRTEPIILVKITSNEEAQRRKFAGSPSFFVNGKDIFPTKQENYFLGCRVYATSSGFRGVPEYEALLAAVRQVLDSD